MKKTVAHRSGADIEKAVARAIASRLHEGAQDLPHDITERLKAARVQAVAKRKIVLEPVSASQAVLASAGQAGMQMGSGFKNLWMQLGSWLPLLALIAGMLVIDTLQDAGLQRRLLKIAIPDQFTECGSHSYLLDRYGLSTTRIIERVA